MSEEDQRTRRRLVGARTSTTSTARSRASPRICKVRLLDPGVIERVLHNDASVCGTQNKAAFDKLRQALMMHYHVRDKAVGAIGEAATAEVDRRNRRQHPQAARQAARGRARLAPRFARRAASHTKGTHMNTDRTAGAKPRHRDQGFRFSSASARSSRATQFTRTPRARPSDDNDTAQSPPIPARAPSMWTDWYSYAVDATQRSILFWDTIRQRGNNFVAAQAGGAAAGAALRVRDGASTDASSRVRSTTRSCASCRPKA